MTKVKKQENNKLMKKYSPEETKGLLLRKIAFDQDLNYLLHELGSEILPKCFDGSDKEKENLKKEGEEKAILAMRAMEMETHLGVMESFDARYRGMVRELCPQIIKEYQCSTTIEKTLAEVIANSFIRIIDNSRRLNDCMDAGKYLSEERTHYLAILSKQIDRANRQYLSALMTLKQLKTPAIEMNIKAKNAFVSQNQQINVDNNKNNEAK